MKTMEVKEFKKKMSLIQPIADKYKFLVVGNDPHTSRLTLKDELSIWRIDIYLTKMTVVFQPAGGKIKYYKRFNLEKIEDLLKNPYKYE